MTHFSRGRRHLPPSFSAQDAARIAIGAFYKARSCKFGDSSELLENWLLAMTSKLKRDDITRKDFAEVMKRWEGEENPDLSRLKGNGLLKSDNPLNNPDGMGVGNG